MVIWGAVEFIPIKLHNSCEFMMEVHSSTPFVVIFQPLLYFSATILTLPFHFCFSPLQALPFSSRISVAEEMLTLKSFSTFCGSMIPPLHTHIHTHTHQVGLGKNDVHRIDVSHSNTLSKYICIHWASLLNHSALAAALRDSLHPEGDAGRGCKASCRKLKRLYLCIS